MDRWRWIVRCKKWKCRENVWQDDTSCCSRAATIWLCECSVINETVALVFHVTGLSSSVTVGDFSSSVALENLGQGLEKLSSPKRLDLLWGQPSLLFNGYRIFFPWRQRDRGMNKCSCTSTPSVLSSWLDKYNIFYGATAKRRTVTRLF